MPLAFWRLIRVFLVVLGPVLSIYFLIQLVLAPELRDRGERLLHSSAEVVHEGANRFCEYWLGRADARAQEPAFLAFGAPALSAEAMDAAKKESAFLLEVLSDLRRVEIFDVSGRKRFDSGGASAFDDVDRAGQARLLFASQRPRVLARALSGSFREPSFFFLVPLKGTNSVVFGMEVEGGSIQDLLRARLDEAGLGSFAALFDEDRKLIATSLASSPDWLEKSPLDPEIAKRLSGPPPIVSNGKKDLSEQANEMRHSLRQIRVPHVFRTRHAVDGETYHVVLGHLDEVSWTVAVQVPSSAMTGVLDQARFLILLIGLIAAAVAFFAFHPDKRTFDSARTLRPEFGAIAIGLLLAGLTIYLRSLVFQLAEEEAQDTGQRLASSCSRQIEDHFRLRSILLQDLSRQVLSSTFAETTFRQRAAALRREFGGTLLVRWDEPPKDGVPATWVEGEGQTGETGPLPTGIPPQGIENGETQIMLFSYPGGGGGALAALRFSGGGREGWLFWAESLAEIVRRAFSVVPVEGYQVTVVSAGQRFALFPDFRGMEDLSAQQSRVSLPGEDWVVEVHAGESIMGHRYQILGLVVLILGFVLAGGGAAAAYLGSTNAASLREVSAKDDLTGLKNRRAFNEMIERAVSVADRYRRALALMLLDLDHFKRINDTMGHAVGDDVLRVAADVLQKAVRETDMPFRFGGEEFAVILVETDLVSASGIAERIRLAMESTPFSTEKGQAKLTVSIGVTGFLPGESIDQFLTRADMALYRAKAEGRNRVVVDRPPGWEA